MTRPLRRAHLRIWLVLTVLLAAVFAASLRQRPYAPGSNRVAIPEPLP